MPAEKIVWHNRLTSLYFILRGARKKALALMQKQPIQLIHLNDGSMTLGISRLKKRTSLPILCTFHGLDLTFPSKLYQKSLISRIQKLDKLITVSTATKNECLQRSVSEDKIRVIPNGVNIDMQDIPKDPDFKNKLEAQIGISLNNKKILLSVGRPVPRKGMSWFMENVLTHLYKDVIYIVVGAPLKRDRFLRKIIHFLPKRRANQVALIYGIGLDKPKQLELL
jgi:phosphatidylinositol alpha-1,6-mannosyltransferase